MDAITQAFQAIQPALKPATEIAGVGSTAYNLYNQYQNQQYQNNLRSYAQDPAKMNAYAAQFTQPLNAGLTTSVANNAQAYLASRGLSDSPQIAQTVESQAIAPYIQQNQQQGYQNALQALNLGGGAVNPNTASTNSIAALAKMFAGGPGGTGSAPGALPSLQDYLRTMGTQPAQIDQSQFNPGQAPTAPIDTSSWTGDGVPDLSSFYQPDYAAAGAGAGGSDFSGN